MKKFLKTTLIALSIIVFILCLGSCEKETDELKNTETSEQTESAEDTAEAACEHEYEESVLLDATCTSVGIKKRTCEKCGFSETLSIEAKGHTEVTDAAISPSCLTVGITEGKRCSTCNAVLEAQKLVAALGHVYDGEDDTTCNRCDLPKGQEPTPSCEHKNTLEATITEATCQSAGSKYKYCADCSTILEIDTIAKGSHVEAIDAAVAATCTETGLTEGKHCSVCNTILVAQRTVPCAEHDFTKKIDDEAHLRRAASYDDDETYWYACYVCDAASKTDFWSVAGTAGSQELEYEVVGGKAVITGLGCEDIKIKIPEIIDGYTVTAIGEAAFREMPNLRKVIISDTVTKIGAHAFRECENLQKVTISDSVTSIEGAAFTDCEKLKTVLVDNLTEIGNRAFMNCTMLSNISFIVNVTNIGEEAFYGCSSITSLAIPEKVELIKASAFENCTGLTEIIFHNDVIEIESRAFAGCTGIYLISLDVKRVGASAFKGCSLLTKVFLGDNLASIGANAFADTALNYIFYNSSDDWRLVSKGENWDGGLKPYIEFMC